MLTGEIPGESKTQAFGYRRYKVDTIHLTLKHICEHKDSDRILDRTTQLPPSGGHFWALPPHNFPSRAQNTLFNRS